MSYQNSRLEQLPNEALVTMLEYLVCSWASTSPGSGGVRNSKQQSSTYPFDAVNIARAYPILADSILCLVERTTESTEKDLYELQARFESSKAAYFQARSSLLHPGLPEERRAARKLYEFWSSITEIEKERFLNLELRINQHRKVIDTLMSLQQSEIAASSPKEAMDEVTVMIMPGLHIRED